MKTRWIGLLAVLIVAAGIVALKLDRAPKPAVQTTQNVQSSKTGIILVANLSEANDKADNCSVIIHLVSEAGKRGIKVRELSPGSRSPLIKRYHVLTIPTLLVLHDGRVVSRFQGESGSTVRKIRTRLAALHGAGH
jgi:thioredoxin-like negative regulator of GroEL